MFTYVNSQRGDEQCSLTMHLHAEHVSDALTNNTVIKLWGVYLRIYIFEKQHATSGVNAN